MHVRLAPAAQEAEFADSRLVGDWLAELPKMMAGPQTPPWCSYAARIDGQVVGFGGFKGKPDEAGAVEIGYLTLSPQRGHGVANAICAKLVAIAFGNDASAVLAHTLPEVNASTSVLSRQAFACRGEVHDPEDGIVWRWVRTHGPVQAHPRAPDAATTADKARP